MISTQIILAVLWICTMLTYLLGDVLRIISGDMERMKEVKKFNQWMWLGIAVLMVIPIVMAILCLALPQASNRIANIIIAAFFFIFNLMGVPTYPSYYDRFLLIVSMIFNVICIILALQWN